MATANFILRGSKENKPHSITLLFRYSNKVLKYPSGEKVLPKNWSTKKQEVKNLAEVTDRDKINESLSDLKTRALTAFNDLNREGIEINNNSLRERLNGSNSLPSKKASSYVSEFLEKFIEGAPTRPVNRPSGITDPLKPSTIKQYNNTLGKIKEFEGVKRNNQKLKFSDLDMNFHEDFISFLQDEFALSNATISSRIKDLKRLSKYAQQKGAEVHPDIYSRDFYRPTDESEYTYLDEKEIQQIFEFDFSFNERLENARDLLILACNTGQRISDFMRIKPENIDFKKRIIHLKQVKTGQKVIIPLHWQVEEIIEKREGQLPRRISDQKFNNYIKELCKIAGLTKKVKGTKKVKTEKGVRKVTGVFPKYELIFSHTGRRSFASNNYGKIPNVNLMAITGHKTEKTFLQYIKITPEEHAEKMLEVWQKERAEYLENKNRKNQLKAV